VVAEHCRDAGRVAGGEDAVERADDGLQDGRDVSRRGLVRSLGLVLAPPREPLLGLTAGRGA